MFRFSHRSFASSLSLVLTIFIVGQPVFTGMAFAQGPPSEINTPNGKVIVPPSSAEQDSDEGIRAHTNHVIFLSEKPQVTGSVPAGENPASLACVYNLVDPSLNPGCLRNPSSATFTNPAALPGVIVIVDAYHYPTAYADLTAFSNQFGLPVLPLCNGSGAPCFAVSYANGQQPSLNCGWSQEASLDIEWAHAMAPGASIVLVEAASSSFSDLLAGVDVATSIIQNRTVTPSGSPTTGQVSMSWGGNEFRGESSYDYHFNHTGIAYFAAAGDTGGKTIWPGVSPSVISAGGTRVNRDSAGNFVSESAWSRETCGGGPCGGGGGPSRYESRPSYQDVISSIVGRSRGTPDFSFDGDPYTGVAVYGPTCSGSNPSGWMVFGGTSVSSPALAGIVDLAQHNMDTAGPNFAEQKLLYTGYPNYSSSTFRDITSGNNGYAAQSGWDFATGIGSDQGLNGK